MAKKRNALPARRAERAAVVSAGMAADFTQDRLLQQLTSMTEPDVVLQKAGVSREQLRVLLGDDEIFQAAETRNDALYATPWRLEPSDGDAADLVFAQLSRWLPVILRTAMQARYFGYSVIRADWANEGGQNIWSAVSDLPMRWFQPRSGGDLRFFPADGRGGVEGIRVHEQYPWRIFPTYNNPTYDNPRGDALLARLYWPWFFRNEGWKFWGKFLERFGAPLLVGKAGDGGSPAEMMQALLQAHGQAALGINHDDEVQAIQSGSNGDSFDKFETASIRRIQKVILGQTLTSGTDGGSGNRALGGVHNDVRIDKRNSDIQLVTPTVQAMVDALLVWNGYAPGDVVFSMSDGKGLEAERAARDATLYGVGVRFSRQYFEDEYNLSADHFMMDGEQPQAGLPIAARSLMAGPRFTPEQQQLEQLADTAIAQAGQPIEAKAMQKLVARCSDPGELERELFKLLPTATRQEFNRALGDALYVADLQGWADSEVGHANQSD